MIKSSSNSYEPPTPDMAKLAEDQQSSYQKKNSCQNELEGKMTFEGIWIAWAKQSAGEGVLRRSQSDRTRGNGHNL